MSPLRWSLIALALIGTVSCGKGGVPSCPLDRSPPVADAGAGSGGAGGGAGGGDAGASDAGVSDAGVSDAGAALCPTCDTPGACGQVQVTSIEHAAGIAASQAHDGIFYVIEKLDVLPRIYAVDRTGTERAHFTLQNVSRVSWEDIAVGPCPTGSCIYVADTGDPAQQRGGYIVHRVPEPSISSTDEALTGSEALLFVYPDGSHDASALVVHPTTRVISVITREQNGGKARIYDFPQNPLLSMPSTLSKQGEITSIDDYTPITGADVHPEGLGVLIRAGIGLLFYPMTPKQSVAQALSSTQTNTQTKEPTPCPLPVQDEDQAEAVAWLKDGKGYVTLGQGASPPLNFNVCAPLAQP